MLIRVLIALGLVIASSAARADDVRGGRPDNKGRLVLPGTGLIISVPRSDRAGTEVWGRVGPGTEVPAVSDEIAVQGSGGLLALSVVATSADCTEFNTLPGVEGGVRIGRNTWSRHAQPEVVIDPGTPLIVAVFCRPGLVVHAAAPAKDRRLGAWLDAIVAARKTVAAWDPKHGGSPVLIEPTDDSDVLQPWPETLEFALKSVRQLLTTRLPLARLVVDQRPADVLAADHFALLMPSAWQAALAVEYAESPKGCEALPKLPSGLDDLPDAFVVTLADVDAATLCRPMDPGHILRLRIRGDANSADLLAVVVAVANELAPLLP